MIGLFFWVLSFLQVLFCFFSLFFNPCLRIISAFYGGKGELLFFALHDDILINHTSIIYLPFPLKLLNSKKKFVVIVVSSLHFSTTHTHTPSINIIVQDPNKYQMKNDEDH